jgi:hypothetical protein
LEVALKSKLISLASLLLGVAGASFSLQLIPANNKTVIKNVTNEGIVLFLMHFLCVN